MLPMEPYARVTYGGVKMNVRTRDMVKHVEAALGFKLSFAQGSYNKGVGASGGTHDGGGALDIRTSVLSSTAQRISVVRALKDAGFAAWYRAPLAGVWGPHIHAIALGDKEASANAKWQMSSYRSGRNGLSGNALDKTYRPDPEVIWDYKAGRPRKRR